MLWLYFEWLFLFWILRQWDTWWTLPIGPALIGFSQFWFILKQCSYWELKAKKPIVGSPAWLFLAKMVQSQSETNCRFRVARWWAVLWQRRDATDGMSCSWSWVWEPQIRCRVCRFGWGLAWLAFWVGIILFCCGSCCCSCLIKIYLIIFTCFNYLNTFFMHSK